jgi:cleavage and polyadenylation specificity factor subunit 2
MSGIKFTPLSGVQSDGEPLCYVLEVDDFIILLDCGWNESFSLPSPYLSELAKWAPKITHVLLSHSSLQHVGALPYLMEKLNCKGQVFATLPVVKMGLMFLYDGYQNKKEQEEFDLFDLDDIDNAFNVSIVKYSQKVTLASPKGDSIVICAYPSGHTLGGTIWKFFREDEEFLYAVDYNIRAEKHLNPCALQNLGKPTLLITDAYNALNTNEGKATETNFLLKVTSTLARKGNVLIPCDTAGRVFELLLVLDTLWRKERHLHSYNIVFLSSMSFRSVEFASHQLEWMSESIVKGFDEKRENPFMFKHIKMKHRVKDLEKLNQPLVVLCTSATLETGYAKELFVRWAGDSKNAILFTDKSNPGTLARKLVTEKPKKLTLVLRKKVLLVGEELDDYEHKRLMQLEAEKKKKREEEARKKVIQIHDDEEVSEDEKEDQEEGIISNPKLFLPDNIRYTSTHLMFPCIEKVHEFDDYGEKINVEELASRQSTKVEIEDEDEESNPVEEEEMKEPPSKYVEESHST